MQLWKRTHPDEEALNENEGRSTFWDGRKTRIVEGVSLAVAAQGSWRSAE